MGMIRACMFSFSSWKPTPDAGSVHVQEHERGYRKFDVPYHSSGALWFYSGAEGDCNSGMLFAINLRFDQNSFKDTYQAYRIKAMGGLAS